MKIIGISGLPNAVAFKQEHWSGLELREYRISQGHDAAAALIVMLVPILEKGNRNGLGAARSSASTEANEFYVAFSPEREDPGNIAVARQDIPKVIGDWIRERRTGGSSVRIRLPSYGAGILARSCRDDQVAGEHLSPRQHRTGQ